MTAVLLQSMAVAAGGLLSFGSITIVVLLLLSERGWRPGAAYATGYVAAYTTIGTGAVLLGTGTESSGEGEPGSVSAVILLVLGLVLVIMAIRNWRRSPADASGPPKFLQAVDRLTTTRAFGLGVAVTVLNVKNLAIFLSAVSVAVLSDLPRSSQLIIVGTDVVVFGIVVIAPVLIYLLAPAQAQRRLTAIKQSLDTHRRAIGIWVPALFGVVIAVLGTTRLL